MKVGLVIPIFNRPAYVKRCFDSLRKLTTKPDVIVLVDDASTDYAIRDIIDSFYIEMHSEKNNVIVWHNVKNKGIKGALETGIELIINDCDIVINLDSDAIVKPDFIERLVKVHSGNEGHFIVSGFNCHNDKNPIIDDYGWFVTKAHANGINMCFNRKQYEEQIKPALLSQGNWDFNTKANFAITIPSCVQHIGIQSSMGHVGADIAHDFKQITLPNVTLFGIDSHKPEGIKRAAEICQRDIEFGAVKIITDDLFTKGGSNEVRRRDYSRFMMKELSEHFTTSHVLTIHEDGYIINPYAWSDEFLQYDYIGATWWYKDNMNVGNGGFSLRSKKLCDILASQNIDERYIHPEDDHICRTFRPSLEKDFGIKFAPEEVANRFSIEAYGIPKPANIYNGAFGFHGVHVDSSNHMTYNVPKEILYARSPQPVQRKQQPIYRNTRLAHSRK